MSLPLLSSGIYPSVAQRHEFQGARSLLLLRVLRSRRLFHTATRFDTSPGCSPSYTADVYGEELVAKNVGVRVRTVNLTSPGCYSSRYFIILDFSIIHSLVLSLSH